MSELGCPRCGSVDHAFRCCETKHHYAGEPCRPCQDRWHDVLDPTQKD